MVSKISCYRRSRGCREDGINSSEKWRHVYLRLILKNRAGALSHKDLRTINGVDFPTFKCACIALNLCESDKQWIDCLDEAVAISIPCAICQLFANILLHCQPSDPKAMYDQFCNDMSEAFFEKKKTCSGLLRR